MEKDHTPLLILIAEDSTGDYFLVTEYISEKFTNAQIIWTKTAEETKQQLEQNSQSFDIVLLDLSLPDKAGEELIMQTLPCAKNSPVVVLTGYTDVVFAVKSLKLGVSDYLLKDELNEVTLYKSIIYNIERHKNLVRLKESEKRYSELFHLSPQPMWLADLKSNNILDVNQAAQSHYGYNLQEFLQLKTTDLGLTKDNNEQINGHQNYNNKLNFKGIFNHYKKDKTPIKVEIWANNILINNTQAQVILANDITDRHNYLTAIEAQNKQLKAIAFTQSHVVRAPLARLMGLINLINDPTTQLDEKQELLKYVLISANELDDIIKNVVSNTKRIKPSKTL